MVLTFVISVSLKTTQTKEHSKNLCNICSYKNYTDVTVQLAALEKKIFAENLQIFSFL